MSHCMIADVDVQCRTTFASCDLVQKFSSLNTVKYQMSLSVTENKQGDKVLSFTILLSYQNMMTLQTMNM